MLRAMAVTGIHEERCYLPAGNSLRAHGALLAVAFIWGASFPLVKSALDDASPLLFLALRFLLATLLALPLFPALRGHWARGELAGGMALGVLLGVAFTLQTLGLAQTTPSRSAFLTSLYVVFVPVLSLPVTGHRPRAASWCGAILALGGLALMTRDGALFRWQPGDLLTLGCALAFALHILGVGLLTARHDFRRLFVVQIATAAVLLTMATPLEAVRWQPSLSLAGAVLLAGGLATTLAFYVQNRVQSRTSSSRTAIIFAMEPVFAVLVVALLAGGRWDLSLPQTLGASLIVAGLMVAALGARVSEPQAAPGPGAGPRRRTTSSP
ncbi:MAG: DMT family transporter [Acidobacteria bacterium]|nr:DMT family transporter [Acidobacteriota bacterium]